MRAAALPEGRADIILWSHSLVLWVITLDVSLLFSDLVPSRSLSSYLSSTIPLSSVIPLSTSSPSRSYPSLESERFSAKTVSFDWSEKIVCLDVTSASSSDLEVATVPLLNTDESLELILRLSSSFPRDSNSAFSSLNPLLTLGTASTSFPCGCLNSIRSCWLANRLKAILDCTISIIDCLATSLPASFLLVSSLLRSDPMPLLTSSLP